MISTKEYSERVGIAHRKKYAQFFTPEIISDFMANWILANTFKCTRVLDPAFGLGVFCHSLLKINKELQVTGYDIDDKILSAAHDNFSSVKKNVSIYKQNYLKSSWDDKYDAIICNPPYLKFHDYNNADYVSEVNRHLGTRLSGFTNIYTLFLLKSISQLKKGGRLAYIIPSEFLNSDYGVEVKRALIKSNTLKYVFIVDFTESAFDDAITTASIILCENNDCTDRIRFSTIKDINNLDSCFNNCLSFAPKDLDVTIKWKQYYEQTSASDYQHLVPFNTFAKVSRGIATGANDFFIFKRSKLDNFNIKDSCVLPCICHSQDVKTPIFSLEDFFNLANSDKNVYLFNACSNDDDLSVKDYLKLGEQQDIHKRYLTASRKPWYAIENRPPAPIWVSVFNRHGLRFVRNEANIYNLTTFHCVYNIGRIETDVLFAYLLTNVAKQILLDNSRQYGNGLVKFEPNDLNKGMVVDLTLLTEREVYYIKEVYKQIKSNKYEANESIELLNYLFKKKFTGEDYNVENLILDLQISKKEAKKEKRIVRKTYSQRIKQLNLFEIFQQYPNTIVENNIAHEDFTSYNSKTNNYNIKTDKNVLISLVKTDNEEQYLNKSAKIYYTGKRFPSTVALNKLYYFIPYIKHRGIRDLYLIKTARIGSRKEGQPDNDPNDYRIVFDIEFVKKLFDDYKLVDLKIWRSFTDTTINQLLTDNN